MKKILVFLIALLCLFSISSSVNNVVVEAVSSTYYSGTESLTGDALLNKLAEITKKNHTRYTSYDDLRTMNHYSDPDPKDDSKLLDFYSRISVDAAWDGGKAWNREHVWPQSLSGGLYGKSGAGSDVHHIRPTIPSINSARNNAQFTDFEMVNMTGKEYKYGSTLVAYHIGQDYWEPLDNVKGDTARIVMYMYMHYSNEVTYNKSNHSYAGNLRITNVIYGTSSFDAWDILLYWNDLDPVDDYEANRNEYCASVTGTRNPFIDNPDFADAIWGDGTSSGGNTSDTTYSVNYQLPSGASFSYSDSTKYTSGSKVNEPTVTPTLAGHTFVGWYTNSSYTTKWNFASNTISTNLTLYAKFEENLPQSFDELFTKLSIKSQLTFDVTEVEGSNVSVPVDGTATITDIISDQGAPGDYDLKDYFTFDNSLFDIQYKKNSTSYSYINAGKSQIRLYNSADKNGSSIEITAKNGVKIISVEPIVDIDDSKIKDPTITIDSDGGFASIQNTSESGQCRLNGFVIKYQTNAAPGKTYTLEDNSLKLKYVLQLTPGQYELYLDAADGLKMYINNEEVSYSVVELENEYRLVYSISIEDYSTKYTPKFTYNGKNISLDGYSAKSLATYYINNLSSDSLVKQYKSCLLEISK